MDRRGFLLGIGSTLITAPAIVHPYNIMPVRPLVPYGFPELAELLKAALDFNILTTHRTILVQRREFVLAETCLRRMIGSQLMLSSPLIQRPNFYLAGVPVVLKV
jgi:hypothetical protein